MKKQLLNDLQERIRGLEQAQRRTQWPARISSGFAALDRLLPGQGFAGGTLVEWLSAGPGMGAMTLALAAAGNVLRTGGVLVVVDGRGDFFPPAAAGLGVPLERTVVVQPGTGRHNERTAWWALEQALRSEAVSATLGTVGQADPRVLRRLQLAAEVGGGLGFLIRPLVCRKTVCWADLRLLVQGEGSCEDPNVGWRLQVELLLGRGGTPGGKSVVELTDETHTVSMAAELDGATARPRQAGA